MRHKNMYVNVNGISVLTLPPDFISSTYMIYPKAKDGSALLGSNKAFNLLRNAMSKVIYKYANQRRGFIFDVKLADFMVDVGMELAVNSESFKTYSRFLSRLFCPFLSQAFSPSLLKNKSDAHPKYDVNRKFFNETNVSDDDMCEGLDTNRYDAVIWCSLSYTEDDRICLCVSSKKPLTLIWDALLDGVETITYAIECDNIHKSSLLINTDKEGKFFKKTKYAISYSVRKHPDSSEWRECKWNRCKRRFPSTSYNIAHKYLEHGMQSLNFLVAFDSDEDLLAYLEGLFSVRTKMIIGKECNPADTLSTVLNYIEGHWLSDFRKIVFPLPKFCGTIDSIALFKYVNDYDERDYTTVTVSDNDWSKYLKSAGYPADILGPSFVYYE